MDTIRAPKTWYEIERDHLTSDEKEWLRDDPVKRRELALFTYNQARRDDKYEKYTTNSHEKPEPIAPTSYTIEQVANKLNDIELTDRQRRIISMRLDGKTTRDIAKSLGVQVRRVQQLMANANIIIANYHRDKADPEAEVGRCME